MLNESLQEKLPGTTDKLSSADTLENNDDVLRFNQEYLNTLNPTGFPTHILRLKKGMPLMLLRNLNPREGLCNGTKLIYLRSIDNKVLECQIVVSNETSICYNNQQISGTDSQDGRCLASDTGLCTWSTLCCLLAGW